MIHETSMPKKQRAKPRMMDSNLSRSLSQGPSPCTSLMLTKVQLSLIEWFMGSKLWKFHCWAIELPHQLARYKWC